MRCTQLIVGRGLVEREAGREVVEPPDAVGVCEVGVGLVGGVVVLVVVVRAVRVGVAAADASSGPPDEHPATATVVTAHRTVARSRGRAVDTDRR